jgi:hypothetical protein
MNKYDVTVRRILVETIKVEVVAEDEEKAEAAAISEVEYTTSAYGWTEQNCDHDIDVIELVEEDVQKDDPLDDFNYVGSRHHY